MGPTLSDVLTALTRSREQMAAALGQAADSAQRAARIAEALAAVWPAAPLHACLLWDNGQAHVWVRDATGLRAAGGGEIQPQETDQESGARWLTTPAPPGHVLVSRDVRHQESWLGSLALAVPADADRRDAGPTETVRAAQVVLDACAECLAFRLSLERLAGEQRRREEDSASLSWLANQGELAGPLAHEFNNYLNSLLLHLALLEQEMPECLRPELDELRRQGKRTAETIKQWQQLRRNAPGPPPLTPLPPLIPQAIADLNREAADMGRPLIHVITDPADPPPAGAVPLQLELAPNLPPVVGHPLDLKRLCAFLLSNAARATGTSGGGISLHAEKAGGQVLLSIRDSGPAVEARDLADVFELRPASRPGTISLELAACKSMARRLKGKIRAESRPEGGLAVIVALPARST